ncbi:MAG: CheY-like chemotaxis protein [Verrucomicrobiales bacterium]|jgi:CheY-like chemotaxis protein
MSLSPAQLPPESLVCLMKPTTFSKMDPKVTRYLVVEDDDDHAQLIARNLRGERAGNVLNRAHDGVEALAYLRKEPPFEDAPRPDVILLDLKMPKLDGHEVLKAIRADSNLASIPVIIITTSDAESDRSRAYEHHVNSYLVKPANFTDFRQMLHDLSRYWGTWNHPAHV